MNVFINNQGELTCSGLDANNTVTDLINAVMDFCKMHINCTDCTQTCCAGLTVYPDHVFLYRLLRLSRQSLSRQDLMDLPIRVMRYDPVAGRWFLLQRNNGRCLFLSQTNRCMIYEARPLVCRLHVCGNIESGLRKMKNALYFAYQDALHQEMAYRLPQKLRSAVSIRHTTNPVLGNLTYDTPLSVVWEWQGGIDGNC